MIEERLAQGYRPRDLAILVRSNDDADPVPARAQRAAACRIASRGNRGLYAREEVRLLVSFLRVLASPDDSVPVFHLAGGELYARAGARPPAPQPPRRAQEPPAARGAARAARGRGAGRRRRRDARGAPRASSPTSTTRPPTCPRHAHGRGPVPLPAGLGAPRPASRRSPARRRRRGSRTSRASSTTVKAYGDVAEHDRVPAFVAHLDLLREAGDDPAVAEADPDDDAVPVLTVHKAKGLEFPVVFLVGCVEQKFPLQRAARSAGAARRAAPGGADRRRPASAGGAAALLRGHDAGQGRAGPDLGRRLRHRARAQGLALRGGGARPALARARCRARARPLEALARHQPAPPEPRPSRSRRCPTARRCRSPSGRSTTTRPARSSTSTSTVCAVPLLVHHRVVYGSAVHKAVQAALPRRASRAARSPRTTSSRPSARPGCRRASSPASTRSSGCARARRRCGGSSARSATRPSRPTGGRAGVRVLRRTARACRAATTSWSSTRAGSPSSTSRRAPWTIPTRRRSARRRACSSTSTRSRTCARPGRLPDWVELRFLESGLSRRQAADGRGGGAHGGGRSARSRAQIRQREFEARPSYLACGQCAFRDICPHTARNPEAET